MENLTIKNSDFESNTISLNTENEKNPIIKFCENGDIFVKGKLVENDLEVVEGMREFLKQSNVIKSVCDVCDSTTDKPTYKLCDKHYSEYEKFKQTVLKSVCDHLHTSGSFFGGDKYIVKCKDCDEEL